MAKTGYIRNAEGDAVRITFSGEGLTEEALDVVDVILQQDGGGGVYTPVAYATASITCLTNGLGLMELLKAKPLAVAVSVYNETTLRSLFEGYISPNSFNQPIDGFNDIVTIECVDYIGAAKFIPYRNLGEVMSSASLNDIVLHISNLISNYGTAVMLADFVRLVPGSQDVPITPAYEKLVLSESYMYATPCEPTLMPDGSLSYEPNAMSCYDALAMIAESVRATWVQFGSVIYLLDYLQLAENGTAIMRGNRVVGSTVYVSEDTFASAGSTISALPRYARVSIDQKANTMRVTPDIFAGAAAISDATKDKATEGSSLNTIDIHMSQLLSSPVVDIPTTSNMPNPGYYCAHCVGHRVITADVGEQVDKITAYNDGSDWESYMRIYTPVGSSNSISDAVVTIKSAYRMPAVPSRRLIIKLKITAGVTYNVDYFSPLNIGEDWEDPDTTLTNILLGAYIKIDDLYYDVSSDSWTKNRPAQYINLTSSSKDEPWKDLVYVTGAAAPPPYFRDGKVVDGTLAGNVSIELYPQGLSLINPHATALYIRDLQLSIEPDEYIIRCNSYFPKPDIAYRGEFAFLNDYPTVKQSLRFGFPMGEKPYGTVIDGHEYCDAVSVGSKIDLGGAMMFVDTPDGERYDMLDRIYSLANIGDGVEFSLTLRDAHNSTDVVSAYTCDAWQGYKVLVGYTRDIKNSTITVIID